MNSDIKIIFGERLKSERIKNGYSQKELAKLLGLGSISTLGNWETGIASPDFANLCFLADLFKVSTDYLLGRTESVESDSEIDNDYKQDSSYELLKKYDSCDEIGQGAIEVCINYHFNRCTSVTPAKSHKNKQRKPIKRLFLREDIDDNYSDMQSKMRELKILRKHSKKSYMEITNFLWDCGYGEEICLGYIMDIFGVGLNKRVPCEELYNDIEAFLTGTYRVYTSI